METLNVSSCSPCSLQVTTYAYWRVDARTRVSDTLTSDGDGTTTESATSERPPATRVPNAHGEGPPCKTMGAWAPNVTSAVEWRHPGTGGGKTTRRGSNTDTRTVAVMPP